MSLSCLRGFVIWGRLIYSFVTAMNFVALETGRIYKYKNGRNLQYFCANYRGNEAN